MTLTHNAVSLILPTGGNIVTEAGDTAIAWSGAGGNWIVTHYQRKSGLPLVSPLPLSAGGTNAATARAACAALGAWHTLAKSAVLNEINNEGSTAEEALATVAIPAGAMGPNGILKVTALWSFTNSANDKTLRVRLGGILGSVFMARVLTTNLSEQTVTMIRNRNAQNSQVGFQTAAGTFFGPSSNNVVTAAVDTSAAVDLVISGQLETAAERVTLEAYQVEVLYGA